MTGGGAQRNSSAGSGRETLLLASRSPRRAALLRDAGIPFEVAPAFPATSETVPVAEDGGALAPGEIVRRLAVRKVRAAVAAMPGRLVLAADTLVFLDDRPLGKPTDAEDALRMLRALSGREHLVATGVALAGPGRGPLSDHAATRVRFRSLAEAEIRAYVDGGEPLDKAGAYGIQGEGRAFVAAVEGAVDTVIGLPVALVRRFMALWGEAGEGSSRS